MRTLLFLLLAGVSLGAAEIQVIVRNDAGTQVASITITTTNEVLQKVNEWRLAQMNLNVDGSSTLKFADTGELLRHIIADFLRKNVLEQKPSAAIQAELDKIDTAKTAIESLKNTVVQ